MRSLFFFGAVAILLMASAASADPVNFDSGNYFSFPDDIFFVDQVSLDGGSATLTEGDIDPLIWIEGQVGSGAEFVHAGGASTWSFDFNFEPQGDGDQFRAFLITTPGTDPFVPVAGTEAIISASGPGSVSVNMSGLAAGNYYPVFEYTSGDFFTDFPPFTGFVTISNHDFTAFSGTPPVIPEPGSIALVGVGIALALGYRRRRRS